MQFSRQRILLCFVLLAVATTIMFRLGFARKPWPEYYGHPDLQQHDGYFTLSSKERTSLDYDFVINSNVCSDDTGPFLVVLVLTTANGTSQREAIRNTWGSVAKTGLWPGIYQTLSVRLVFLLGELDTELFDEELQEEAAEKGDIVLANFKDGYYNLTLKVLMGFRWVEDCCSHAEFIMKVDEDIFVNVPYFLSMLAEVDLNRQILGPFFYADHPAREGKYSVTVGEYSFPWYPPYVKGNMYIMSKATSLKLLQAARYVPYLHIEDVFITGVLAKIWDLRHVNVPDVSFDRTEVATYCEVVNAVKVMSHTYTPVMMQTVWELMHDKSNCS